MFAVRAGVGLCAGVLAALLLAVQAPRLYGISEGGAKARGEVRYAGACARRSFFYSCARYDYEVRGETYTGMIKTTRTLHRGDPVTVWYARGDPGDAVTDEPFTMLIEALLGGLVALAVFAWFGVRAAAAAATEREGTTP